MYGVRQGATLDFDDFDSDAFDSFDDLVSFDPDAGKFTSSKAESMIEEVKTPIIVALSSPYCTTGGFACSVFAIPCCCFRCQTPSFVFCTSFQFLLWSTLRFFEELRQRSD